MHGSSVGHGKVPLLSLWKALRVADRSEASSFGAVLIQDEKPVYYASTTLSKAEKNYQNL